uniref:Odorant receptor n=1 Tax=Aphidius gifuensis TaxID=684658 RepID=A0A3S9LWB4_APHGI|nr:odorant receptor [Aphidius gifuensis]
MDTVATSYHKINRKFLKSLGIWPYQSSLSKKFFILLTLFLTITHGYLQTAGMFAALVADIDIFLESVPTVLADVVCYLKYFNFFYNGSKMKELLITMEKDWKKYTSPEECQILDKWARFGRKVTIYYAGALYGTLVPMGLVPLVPVVLDVVAPINGSYPRHLMFQQIEFLFDYEKYFFPLLIHGYFGTMAYLTIIIAIDTIFMVYIQHACAKFEILGLFLDRVANDDDAIKNRHCSKFDEIDYNDMVNCIATHNHAIDFSNLIEEANYVSFLFIIGINMIMMTASALVAAFKIDNPDIAGKFVAFTLGEVFHLFYSSWQGQLLLEHSESIFNQVYQAKWNNASVRTQRLIIPLLMRSAQPCKLTAGKMLTMSLTSFTTVVKTSFSYLTVFTSMRA